VTGRALVWLGHHTLALLMLAVVLSVANDFTAGGKLHLGAIAAGAWVAWLIAWSADAGYHEGHVCRRCATRADDPGKLAGQMARPLAAYHVRWLLPPAVAASALWVAGTGLGHHLPWWAVTLNFVASVIIGLGWALSWVHRKLRPWCPFCDRRRAPQTPGRVPAE
jgi:hypothetical protein